MEQRRRVTLLAAVVLLAAATLAGQAATAGDPASSSPSETPQGGEGAYPGRTLVAVQAYGWFDEDNGSVFILDEDGEKTWEYAPDHAWVFDAEMLDDGNVLVSLGENEEAMPGQECPDEYGDNCVHNRVVEVTTDEDPRVVWEHEWYDAYPTHHEVHDADRLPNGETAIIDMGNNRAFTVDREGEVTWSWQAEDHISEGTAFWEEYVPEDQQEEFRRQGPESDWTHMNDIDRLRNGHFTLSIRNFDVVLEVDPETNEIVNVVGRPGKHSVMEEQHNPNMLERHGTMLVADSEGDRIVEVNAETDERVWTYDGTGSGQRLQWPRDADRLPNGNTLITDSRNFRIIEVGPNGTVVWEYSLADRRGIVYDADRLGLPEEPDDVPAGGELASRSSGPVRGTIATVESWAGFVLPHWMGVVDMGVALVGLAGAVGLGREGWRARNS